ncbi:DUF1127 domain-containing protein [Bradyrhizobium liaoningense]|uniref:DUF1127 domain-containing protein n=1 Tax=Bradyrhizobium liaoningense TaxID=43992 RepID=UPI001BADDFBF|nr:DUF1127 domain-containing protein [Bradyrhizobium liaoningense]MBR0907998.1 DUF1127 domain-containing protein [Bradyrhizobium liaoningense]
MSTASDAKVLRQAAAPTGLLSRLFSKCCTALQERYKRQRLRAALYDLSDQELKDIGTSRSGIEFIASNHSTDPRAA